MEKFAFLNPYVTVSLSIFPIQLSSVSFQLSSQICFDPVGTKLDFNLKFSLKRPKVYFVKILHF